jgi:hypothetical protein
MDRVNPDYVENFKLGESPSRSSPLLINPHEMLTKYKPAKKEIK